MIEFKGKKSRAYHNGNDGLHFVSADCTHLGCTVKWNNDGKSWDCPCHGSRFTYQGKAMNVPANEALAYHTQNKYALRNI